MPSSKPPSPLLFQRAAELRARGTNWEIIAREIGRAEATVRDWARRHSREWRKAVRAAEAQLAQEATAESVLTLRRQLRSDDEKASREAAGALIKYAAGRRKPRANTGRGAKRSAEIAALAEFVGGLTDDEVAALLRELRAADRTDPVPPPASGPGTPGAG